MSFGNCLAKMILTGCEAAVSIVFEIWAKIMVLYTIIQWCDYTIIQLYNYTIIQWYNYTMLKFDKKSICKIYISIEIGKKQ